jgi:hypothetical protein
MKLPFTVEQFLDVFRKYNTTFFPLQAVFFLLAVYILFLLFSKTKNSGKIITSILAIFWLWMGAAYHIAYFSSINKVAYAFGALFILEGFLLFIHGSVRQQRYTLQKNVTGIIAASLFLYALILYPLIGYVSGHAYPYSPTFGLPCPTVIFTISVFILARPPMPFYIILIPLLWCVLGFSAAFTLGIYEDVGLIVAGLIFVTFHFIKPYIRQVRKNAL